ncbi:DUF2889 domain-containing protein [Desulfosarcina sp. OttesenSCG-928-A07]|nr:DUF2889 domain-containing protein [Desulfosarcina sp. OttesenSCG-928-G17]MDL2328277.1 DUF2889 domain-containing protein [Desulfosarcina sp. OttesenSCG-928-A07]
MITLDKTRQRKIHTRTLAVDIFEGASPDTLVIEGALQDRRHMDTHFPDGKVNPPYVVHHMVIRMAIHLPENTITDIEVDMPTIPNADCIDTKNSLEPIIGLRVAAGFMSAVRKRIPRKDGCTHLLELLTAMAPAVFQGAWSARVSRPIDSETFRRMSGGLKNTCYAWREEGELVRTRIGVTSDAEGQNT